MVRCDAQREWHVTGSALSWRIVLSRCDVITVMLWQSFTVEVMLKVISVGTPAIRHIHVNIPTTPTGIETATFWPVVQCLNQLRHQQRVTLTVGVASYCCPWSHSKTHTLVRTPLDKGSARRRDCYLIKKTLKTDIYVPRLVSSPLIPTSERPQTSDLDRAATGIGQLHDFIAEVYGRTNRHACPSCADFTHVLPYKTKKHELPFFTSLNVCRYIRACSDRQSSPKDFLQIAAMPSASLWFASWSKRSFLYTSKLLDRKSVV
jgi:hypothetical protein